MQDHWQYEAREDGPRHCILKTISNALVPRSGNEMLLVKGSLHPEYIIEVVIHAWDAADPRNDSLAVGQMRAHPIHTDKSQWQSLSPLQCQCARGGTSENCSQLNFLT